MTTIETSVLIIFCIMTLPSLCSLIRRPSLLYCTYLLIGLFFGEFFQTDTHFMVEELGEIGFILLLFQIGLEIDLSSLKNIGKYLPLCIFWLFLQIPLLTFLFHLFGWSWQIGFTAAAGLNACSLGISYNLLQGQTKNLDRESKRGLLVQMVLLEVISLIILSISDSFLTHGWGKEVPLHTAFLIGFIITIRFVSPFVHQHLSNLIETAGKWKLHLLLLAIFSIAILGERIGLSGPKTAFFLGLFMISTTRNGVRFEDELKPIAKRVLIPFFFISLGSKVSLSHLFPTLFIISFLAGLFLIAIRFFLFQKLSNLKNVPWKYFLLYCPNLTMVGVAVEILTRAHADKGQVDFLLTTSLLLTVGSAIFFPEKTKKKELTVVEEPPLALEA